MTAAFLLIIFLAAVSVLLLAIGTQQAQAQAVTPHDEYAVVYSPGKGVGPGALSTPLKGYHMTITGFGNNKPTKARIDAIKNAWTKSKLYTVDMSTARGFFEPVHDDGFAFKLYPNSKESSILYQFASKLLDANIFEYVHTGNWHVAVYSEDRNDAHKIWNGIKAAAKAKGWHIYVVTRHIDKNGHPTITAWQKII